MKTNLGCTFLSTFSIANPLRLLIPLAFPIAKSQPVSHGAIPFLRACFDPSAASGDLWMPRTWIAAATPDELRGKQHPLRAIVGGFVNDQAQKLAVRGDGERVGDGLTMNEGYSRRMWAASEKALGELGEALPS